MLTKFDELSRQKKSEHNLPKFLKVLKAKEIIKKILKKVSRFFSKMLKIGTYAS